MFRLTADPGTSVQFVPSGEVYAVRMLGGEVMEAAGPLVRSEYERALQEGFDGGQDVTEHIQSTADEYMQLSAPESRRAK